MAHYRWEGPGYGVQLLAVAPDGSAEIKLQFQVGEAYCRGWIFDPLPAL